jgi:hypothetical protein
MQHFNLVAFRTTVLWYLAYTVSLIINTPHSNSWIYGLTVVIFLQLSPPLGKPLLIVILCTNSLPSYIDWRLPCGSFTSNIQAASQIEFPTPKQIGKRHSFILTNTQHQRSQRPLNNYLLLTICNYVKMRSPFTSRNQESNGCNLVIEIPPSFTNLYFIIRSETESTACRMKKEILCMTNMR